MSDIYTKTAKGSAEIENRTGTIPQKARRLLIMIDGERSTSEIKELAQVEHADDILALLQEAGLIEVSKQTAAATEAVSSGPLPQFRPLPAQTNAKELEMSRQFIINTLKTFCGPMSHLTIVKAVTAATTHEQMRANYLPWYEAVIGTSAGKAREDELTQMLLKVI